MRETFTRRICLQASLSAALAGAAGGFPLRSALAAASSGSTQQAAPGRKVLTLYFSWSGSSEAAAQEVHRLLGGTLDRIETVVPYPAEYRPTTEVAVRERDANARPVLKPGLPDPKGYDVIVIGHPIWGGKMPMALYTLLEGWSGLSGKTIAHFTTHGGTGLGDSHREIARLLPGCSLAEGLPLYGWGGLRDRNRIAPWLRRIGLLKG